MIIKRKELLYSPGCLHKWEKYIKDYVKNEGNRK
jgi:hypothetical protein